MILKLYQLQQNIEENEDKDEEEENTKWNIFIQTRTARPVTASFLTVEPRPGRPGCAVME